MLAESERENLDEAPLKEIRDNTCSCLRTGKSSRESVNEQAVPTHRG